MSSFTHPPDQPAPEQSGGGLGIRELERGVAMARGGLVEHHRAIEGCAQIRDPGVRARSLSGDAEDGDASSSSSKQARATAALRGAFWCSSRKARRLAAWGPFAASRISSR